MLERFGQRFLAPVFRCFLIWTNIIQIVLLLSKLTLIRWTVYLYSGERAEENPQTTKAPATQFNSVFVFSESVNETNAKVWTGFSSNSSDFFFGNEGSLQEDPQPIQFPILFMAAMMCIVLYIVGLVGM